MQNQENWLLDIDSELEIYFSGLGRVKFGFFRASDVIKIPAGTNFVSSISAGNPLYSILLAICRLLGLGA